MTNEKIVMKIQPNAQEYSAKALFDIIPLSIGLIGFFIGIMALMNGNEDEMAISLGVLIISGVLAFVFAIRTVAFFMKSNKARKTFINITGERISGVNAGLNVDLEISAIISVNIEKASIDVDGNGVPKGFKIDLFSIVCGLTSKYLSIRTNDGKNIYVDCISSLEATKNTIDSIIAQNTTSKKETV